AHRREGAPWYFVLPLLAGFSPWTLLFVTRLSHIAREVRTRKTFHPERLLVVWSVFIFVFFSMSGSKLPSYILPVFPALALLMAPTLREASARAHGWNLAAALLLGVASLIAVLMI